MAKMHKCAWKSCENQCPLKNKCYAKYCSQKCLQASRGIATSRNADSSHEETADSAVITQVTDTEIRSLADLVASCNIDLETWEIERWISNSWGQNFQVKAWLRKRTQQIAIQAEIADLIASTKITIGNSAPSRAPNIVSSTTGLMLELAIPDLHAGKLAWGRETGEANYDIDIASTLFKDALKTLLNRVRKGQRFEKILFPIGNDLLNSDNAQGTTTAGTPQTTDGRYQKTFQAVRKMLVWAIEEIVDIAPAHVIPVPGNHDQLAVWHMGDSLECYFHNHPDVTVDNSPRTRKYYQWGANMLMFTHGDKGKKSNYPLLMATEEPAMWAATQHREAHCGHLHKTSTEVDEFNGVKTRISPALCPPDAWHAEQGYTRQGRGAEAFVWSKDEGLVSMAFYSVPKE